MKYPLSSHTILPLVWATSLISKTQASYCFYVGRDLTIDGSFMIAGTGEEVSGHWLQLFPARSYPPNATISVGVTEDAALPVKRINIPQARNTSRYPSMEYSDFEGFPAPPTNGGLNEHDVAVRDVWAQNREELVEMTPNPQTGVNYGELARIVMERAHTAREGVEIIGELIDKSLEPCAPIQVDAVARISATWRQRKQYKLWADPVYAAKIVVGMKRNWQDPDYRARVTEGVSNAKAHQIPESKADQQASVNAMWADPVQRAALVAKKSFYRDDNDPKKKKHWDKIVKKTRESAEKLSTQGLQNGVYKAFAVFHLDPLAWGVTIPSEILRRDQASVASHEFTKEYFEKASTGNPFWNNDDCDALTEKLNGRISRDWLKRKITEHRELCMRSAAVLRLKGIDVDYASFEHLAWLKE